MATEITMPKLSDTMTEGIFACWKKNVGDRIERGDIIAEIETDKAVMELEAFASGTLIKTMVHDGEHVDVGTVIGLIGNANELAAATAAQPASPSVVPPPPSPEPVAESEPETSPETPHPAPAPVAAPLPDSGHEKASPLVRRIAREEGIDLEKVTGSGPGGRITRDDLAAYTAEGSDRTPPEAPVTTHREEATAGRPATRSMRQAVADTVTRSWQTIPHFSVTVEIDMAACHEIIREVKERPGIVSYNSLVIKACATALHTFPLLRPEQKGSPDGIHIGFAVSVPDGLLVPVIRECQRLSVVEIEAESSRLTAKSRAGRLTSEEMSGGSFSVSNLGMYGVDEFTALILPGQTAILAIGAACERAVVRNGSIAAGTTMRVTLSCDHRCVDGAYAASFLAELRSLLEKPVSLLI